MLMRKSIAAAHIYPTLEALLAAVRDCRACAAHLPLGPRPVLRAGATARILVVGQAPGVRVHPTAIPWDDPSGERLHTWMGVDKDVLYDESRVAIIAGMTANDRLVWKPVMHVPTIGKPWRTRTPSPSY
jgi:uracil-DNA glycosylase